MKADLISNIMARYQIYNILAKFNVNDLNKKNLITSFKRSWRGRVIIGHNIFRVSQIKLAR